MNMKSMSKAGPKVAPLAPSFAPAYKISFLGRLLGLASRGELKGLHQENQELLQINQRNVETIRSLSVQLGDSLKFQQEKNQDILKNLKIVENIPARQDDLQQKMMDICDKAIFLMQTASQDLSRSSQDVIQAKNNLVTTEIDIHNTVGAVEMAEYMASFLVSNLLTKQIRALIQGLNEKIPIKELEISLVKLHKNLQIVQHQMSQINFRLEKYNLRLEESLWKPYTPDTQTAESIENCDNEAFQQGIKICQKIGLFEEGEKIKSLVIFEIVPTISFFHKEKGTWVVKRRGKVSILKPTT